MLQYRYHGRKEKRSRRLVFLADYISNINWNAVDFVCGYLGYSIHKLGEYIQVLGNIHGPISHPAFIQLIAADAAAGGIDNPSHKNHPGIAIHHLLDPG